MNIDVLYDSVFLEKAQSDGYQCYFFKLIEHAYA